MPECMSRLHVQMFPDCEPQVRAPRACPERVRFKPPLPVLPPPPPPWGNTQGSPFLKSTSLFFGFVFGMIVSAVATYEAVAGDKTMCSAEPDLPCIGGFANAVPGKAYSFWNTELIDSAKGATWAHLSSWGLRYGVVMEVVSLREVDDRARP